MLLNFKVDAREATPVVSYANKKSYICLVKSTQRVQLPSNKQRTAESCESYGKRQLKHTVADATVSNLISNCRLTLIEPL